MHMLSHKDLNSSELDTVRVFPELLSRLLQLMEKCTLRRKQPCMSKKSCASQ